MKKGKFILGLLVFVLILPVMFFMTGCFQTQDPEFRVMNNYIQWTTDGENWEDLISLNQLKGQDGNNGTNGKDAVVWTIGPDGYWYEDGKKTNTLAKATNGKDGNGIVSIVKDNIHSTSEITKYVITFDNDKVSYLEVVNGTDGRDGTDGKDATYSYYTVTYDYGYLGLESFFDNYKTSDTVKSTEWLTNVPTVKADCNGDFKGWFIQGTNKKIESNDFIGGNVTLEARWNYLPSGLYSETEYVMTWAEIVETYPKAFVNEGQIFGEEHIEVEDGRNYVYYSYLRGLKGKLVIDQSIKQIGDYAFYNAKGLTSVYIPDSVSNFGSHSFYGCSNVVEYRLSNNLKSIGSYCFQYNRKLEQIELPDGLESIGYGAFSTCDILTSLILPNSVKEICGYLLNYCNSFVYNTTDYDGNVGTGMNYIGTKDNPYFALISIDDFAQDSYILKDGVVIIAEEVFERATNLTEITMPDSVLYIGEYSFACETLSSIKLSKNLTKISEHAFYGTKIEKIVIPDSVTKIEAYAFANCTYLKEVYIPHSVEEIEGGAFASCDDLEKIEINEVNPYYVVENNIVYTRDKTTLLLVCAGGDYEDDFVIPETVTTIAQYAFSECKFYTVTIPNNVTFIGGFAFDGCYPATITMQANSVWNLSGQVVQISGTAKIRVSETGTTGIFKGLNTPYFKYEGTQSQLQDPFDNVTLFCRQIELSNGSFSIYYMDWVKLY